MNKYLKTGFLTRSDLEKELPPIERIKKGFVAVTECIQEIPCNPCVTSCPVDAISMQTINSVPKVNFNKCIGCGNCVVVCPGLAMFLLNTEDSKGRVSLPYEMLPTPKKGEMVNLLNRKGEKIGKGIVTKIISPEKNTRSVVVTVEFDNPKLVYEVRNIEGEG